jgi:dihydrofolate reductase
MKPFKAIAAMSLNRVIGADGEIPWHLPEDFKWFKQMTTGHIIVMGRRTFESIGKPLPHRETVVVSRAGFSYPGVQVVRDLEQLAGRVTPCAPGLAESAKGAPGVPRPALDPATLAEERAAVGQREIFICGGAQVYAQALHWCSDLYLTLVKRTVDGDAFFPPFEDQFELATEIRDAPEFKILHYRNRAP